MIDMSMLTVGAGGLFELWQLIPVALLVAIIVFWLWYRKRQM